ncbi:MAG: hypothetical protein NXI16_07705 [Alphaproteobacteria bacterium]|nr:hypothetical protein [Alphaproteobacteria bacterium]
MRRPPQPAQQTPQPLAPGDRFPDFAAPDAAGVTRIFSFEVDARPAVMLIAASPKDPLFGLALEADADIFALAPMGTPDSGLPRDRRFHERDGRLAAQALAPVASAVMQAAPKPLDRAVYVLDGNQRILAAYRNPDPAKVTGDIEAVLDDFAQDTVEPGFLERGAPVLVVPRVYDEAFCQTLIDYLHKIGPVEGRLSDGTGERSDESKKKTLEHTVTDQAMHNKIAGIVGRRVAPEISKAFGWVGPLRFETFTIMRYGAERKDFFGLHRDNVRQEAGRRFAISINLNDGYEGGALTFPEYGPHSYRPPKGGAAVFACALLHEALPVTEGERYVMTAFLCDPPQQASGAPGQGPARR